MKCLEAVGNRSEALMRPSANITDESVNINIKLKRRLRDSRACSAAASASSKYHESCVAAYDGKWNNQIGAHVRRIGMCRGRLSSEKCNVARVMKLNGKERNEMRICALIQAPVALTSKYRRSAKWRNENRMARKPLAKWQMHAAAIEHPKPRARLSQ